MKKLSTIIVFLLLATGTFAQYFAPVGAKWTYSYGVNSISPPPYTVKPLTIEIIKDTLINGLTCREAEIAISGVVQKKKYIRSINDSVLVYSTGNNQFNLLYDFTANVGDTLKIFADDPWFGGFLDSSLVSIDSVGFKNIKGINYRAYHQTCLYSISSCFEGGMIGWVIDSLGVMDPYYNWPFIDQISYLFLAPIIGGPPNIYPLRCYTDNNTYYNYDNTNCDTTYVVTSVENVSTANLKVYPTVLSNGNRVITIKTINQALPENIHFFSLMGVAIPLKTQKQENSTQISIANKIPSGIYLLNFQLNNVVITRKIIVL